MTMMIVGLWVFLFFVPLIELAIVSKNSDFFFNTLNRFNGVFFLLYLKILKLDFSNTFNFVEGCLTNITASV